MSDLIKGPFPIDNTHEVGDFDCGYIELNDYLRKYALTNHRNNSSKTFVVLKDNKIIGFYSLAVGAVNIEEAPERIIKGLARHPVPVVIITRLGVDNREKGKKIGPGLLKDSFLKIISVADIVAVRAILVHAKDAKSASFYLKYGFIPSPFDPYHLFMLLKDIKKTL
jgi:hypothetical protein